MPLFFLSQANSSEKSPILLNGPADCKTFSGRAFDSILGNANRNTYPTARDVRAVALLNHLWPADSKKKMQYSTRMTCFNRGFHRVRSLFRICLRSPNLLKWKRLGGPRVKDRPRHALPTGVAAQREGKSPEEMAVDRCLHDVLFRNTLPEYGPSTGKLLPQAYPSRSIRGLDRGSGPGSDHGGITFQSTNAKKRWLHAVRKWEG